MDGHLIFMVMEYERLAQCFNLRMGRGVGERTPFWTRSQPLRSGVVRGCLLNKGLYFFLVA